MKTGDQRWAKAYSSVHVYDADEEEFIAAMGEYIRRTRHRFPTWTEALAVLRSLGYRKPAGDSKGEGGGQDGPVGEVRAAGVPVQPERE